ncbi:MAG: hypothetical protein EA351_06055 [Gemmatimonadales bacterium]|nr:MAG: hypothetical protein EA351_06055 [Gemmatimonadales bacterium]
MTVVAGLLILISLTIVHEAGHWLAVRLKGGRVLRLSIGRGAPIVRRGGDPEIRVGLLPLGGRIDYEGIPRGMGQAVVALGGSVANLLFATVLFAAGALLFGVDAFAPAGWTGGGAWAFALESVSGWFWIIPGTIADLVVSQQMGGLRGAVSFLGGLLAGGEAAGLVYLFAAASALWASLNLIPIPGVGTDGWHVLRSVAGSIGSSVRGSKRDPEPERPDTDAPADSPADPPADPPVGMDR